MFDLKDAYNNITLDDIYSKISEYELFMYYCKNFEEFDKSFMSEFYDDNNPDCRIYRSGNNRLRYKDFGTGENLSVIEYIQKKYYCTFSECINIIANDFKLAHGEIVLNRQQRIIQLDETITARPKTRIDIVSQPFTIADYNYWNQYKIPLTLLEEYNVFSAKYVALIKGDKVTNFVYSNRNPIYAYRFKDGNEYVYKIYFPYADKRYKWINNCNETIIQGYDQLSLDKNKVILTKSLKDVMCYRVLGYDAISLQGETNKLPTHLKNLIVNYDNDEEGIRGTERLVDTYGFKHFYIDGAKDLSDFIKDNDLQIAKKQIDEKIKSIL